MIMSLKKYFWMCEACLTKQEGADLIQEKLRSTIVIFKKKCNADKKQDLEEKSKIRANLKFKSYNLIINRRKI